MARRHQYRTVTARSILPGDEIKSANGRTWLPPVTRVAPNGSSGVVSIWWGSPPTDRFPDWHALATATMAIRRPSRHQQ